MLFICIVVILFSFGAAQAKDEKVKSGSADSKQAAVSKPEHQLPTLPKIKDKKKFLLKNDREVLVHVGFESGFIDKGVTLKPVALKESFTIEVIVKPSSEQVNYAGIVGNHPGDGFEGFVIQQASDEQNVYYLTYGDGKKWIFSFRFSRLNAGTWAYLTAVVDRTDVKLYVDGKHFSSQDAQGVIKNSALPLVVGSVMEEGGKRSFNGLIEEVRISNAALPAKEISTNWSNLQKALPK
jgi:hypothetical protein